MHWFFKFLIALFLFIIVWLIMFIIPPKILPQEMVSDGEVHGLLLRNQTWSGTMRVTGDIITGPNTTITLKPGTKILVAKSGDKNNFDLLLWHLKSGINTAKEYHGVRDGEPFWDEKQKIQLHFHKLIAIGTKEQPIIVTSDSNQGSPYDFNVLDIKNGVLSRVQLSNYRRFEIGKNVTISHSKLMNTGECAVCIDGGQPSIINNSFSDNLREYIWVFRASPKISDNLFESSKGVGIRLNSARTGVPIILHNNFEMSQSKALDILGGAENQGGVITFNKFAGGTTIQIPCDSRMKILQNSILGVVSFTTGSCIGMYKFGPNFWGAQDVKTILSDQIISTEKQFKVLIPYILKNPPDRVGRRE